MAGKLSVLASKVGKKQAAKIATPGGSTVEPPAEPLTKAEQLKADRSARADRLLATLSPDTQGLLLHPKKFARNLASGKRGALHRMIALRAQEEALGYGKEREGLSQHYQGALAAGSPVDLQQDERPTLDQYGSYVRERLGTGLTPEEERTYRGAGIESLEGGLQQSARDASSRAAAAGIDPRSGVADQRAQMIARARESGRADVNRNITLADLARKQQIEGEAGNVSAMEEGGREYDVSAQQRRQSDVEGGLAQLAGLGERRREYDTDTAYSGQQAALSRAALARAAKKLEPSTLEKVSGGISGFVGGLTGGGGGGGGMMGH